MKKRNLIVIGIVILSIILISFLLLINKTKGKLVYENGQIGFIINKKHKENDFIMVDGKELALYQTVPGTIEIFYDSINLDNDYQNELIINNNKTFKLSSTINQMGKHTTNKLTILGLNIIDGKLLIEIKAGKKDGPNLNTFTLRNIYIKVNKEEIWSVEYPKSDYLNESINFGEDDLNLDVRYNYNSSLNLTFELNSKLLNASGVMLDETTLASEVKVIHRGKEMIFQNGSYLEIECNIGNEIIAKTKTISVSTNDPNAILLIKMDGIPINNNLVLSEFAWSPGEHLLEITSTNKYGFKKVKLINFELKDTDVSPITGDYDIYQIGVNQSLYQGIEKLGILTNDEKDKTSQLDDDYLLTPYSNSPVITFVVNKTNKSAFNWFGKINPGRTVFMQIYNNEIKGWETVSTALVTDNNEIQLGFDYQGLAKYEVGEKVYFRVSSKITSLSNILITHQIYHWTDMQYIIQLFTLTSPESIMGKKAKKILDDTVNYLINQYQTNNLMYLSITGDMVQQQKGVNLDEWENFINYVLKPLMEAGVPLGVSSGNHDVGGVSSYNPDGSNALDDALTYDYYYQYVGEEKFNSLTYYGGSYKNNRSHFDLINIEGHEFLILYLGWGSSTKYIHVSDQDINWAKTVLEQYPTKTVILATHEYMGNKGKRSLTGDYVYNALVKEYANIMFVISGHINGSSYLIDEIDDNNDGIIDRNVLQLLTNFQEEEVDYFGASFFRMIGLDFINNYLYLNIYSPYYQDYDIFVDNNIDYVHQSADFYYAFDLSNVGYGILTNCFG